MDKNIGFNRNLHLAWLDATAAFCAETEDPAELRARLEPVVSDHLKGVEARRKTIDILINIWVKSKEIAPGLRQEAVGWFQSTPAMDDRLWLHYGVTLLYYPFFRQTLATIGQIGRIEDTVTTAQVKQRLTSERGQIGSLGRATEHIMKTLRDWGILTPSERRYAYVPQRQALSASSVDLEAWLLACALHSHPAEELPFADLTRLPELFPFRFALSLDHLRDSPWFAVQRQGTGWDMVRMTTRVSTNGR